MMELSKKKCIPCEAGMPPMNKEEIKKYSKMIIGWGLKDGKLYKNFKFRDFKETLEFVNKVGKVAEKEGHHPDIYFTWGKCTIELYTHSIKGLSENDFLLAKGINKIR